MSGDEDPKDSTRRRYKRPRKESSGSGDFTIEEIDPDEMGYDADIEVIRPMRYEDVDSESEQEPHAPRKAHTVDEELAERMRRLGRAQRQASPAGLVLVDRGRKRRSVEMDDDLSLLGAPLSPGLEVEEVADVSDLASPAKRRKKKGYQATAAHHILLAQKEAWTDSSDRMDEHSNQLRPGSTSPVTTLEMTTPANEDEAMDIS